MDDVDEPDAEFSLIMPLVVTNSNGGPYDDKAFVAGMRTQQVWETLAEGPDEYLTAVPPEIVPQLDLIAMHFGYVVDVRDTAYPEWAEALFCRQP